MSEAIVREDWLTQVERAFEKLKSASTAEREEVCEVVLLDYGSEAEAELKAKLAAHDQAMQAKGVVKSSLSWRRELPPAIKAPPGRDTLDVAMREPLLLASVEERQRPEASMAATAAQPVRAKPIKLPKPHLGGRAAPQPPPNAGIDHLTYPRGLLGHATQYVEDTAALPNRWLSLATALASLAKGLDRKVLGPTGNSVIPMDLASGGNRGREATRSQLHPNLAQSNGSRASDSRQRPWIGARH